MSKDSTQGERLTRVETKQENFEKMIDHFALKLSGIVDKFNNMIERHEEKLSEIYKQQLDNCAEDRKILHEKHAELKKNLEPLSLIVKYPKLFLALIIAVAIIVSSKGWNILTKII